MRVSHWLTGLVALALTAGALGAAWLLLNPGGPPLQAASVSHAALSPNADGVDDVAVIRYTLRRPATVSLYLVDAAGQRYDFRREKPRPAGDNEVFFSGIVDPFTRPTDTFTGTLLARVLPNGEYTWAVAAQDEAGLGNEITGTLRIQAADTALPELSNLTVLPKLFTPNRDGLDDRVTINVALSKDVDAGGLRLTLEGAGGLALPIAESAGSLKKPGERGLHVYDYDGGVDQGLEPPPDGEYVIRAEAEDRLGQRLVVTTTLTLAQGGLPRAELYQGDVQFSAESVVLGQTLYFTLTVENYGTAPIRTTGPAPDYVYASMGTNYNTIGEYVQAGAFRVGLIGAGPSAGRKT